ncbi:MAG: hypothetical protein PHF46_03685 [Candidatus Gracilibacteria bacterium]|nr:hypothetical protein [Candidatus Gracilibacteria bacterium]MDD3120482.1 hypothetical protein [Candidatus Gracilibacteria bacterium]MDD4530531.1 hypothetical protein [Candidatus Gracilibacteria bacterium]
MKNGLKRLIIFVFISLFFANNISFATSQSWYESTGKTIDKLVETKIGKEKANTYIDKLEKINTSRFSDDKKRIFNYLLKKLKSYSKNSITKTNVETYLNSEDTLKNLPSFINKLISKVYKIVDLDSESYFYENGKKKKLTYQRYYSVDLDDDINSYLSIKNLNKEILFRQNGGYFITSGGFEIKNQLTLEELKNTVYGYAELNGDEFEKNGDKYMLNSRKGFILNSNELDNVDTLGDLSGAYLFKKGNSYILCFDGKYEIIKKLTFNNLSSKVKQVFDNEDYRTYLRGDDYYYFSDVKYYITPVDDGLYLEPWKINKDSLKDLILFKLDGKYYLATEYKEFYLGNKSLYEKISNKDGFFNILKSESYYYKNLDFVSKLTSIKNFAEDLTKNQSSNDDKIKQIYVRLTKSITYDSFSEDYVDGKITKDYYETNVNKEVYSGAGTYKNNNGVCDGFSKLMFYMLYFSGIENAEIETGFSTNGGTEILHSRIKIGNYYYDSTWDIYSLGNPSKFEFYKMTADEAYKTRRKE